MLIEKDSAFTVPFRVFLSNGTAPDTGVSNDSMRGSSLGAAQFTLAAKISAISANAGMYAVQLSASEASVLGSLALWYDQGDFPQHVANLEVANFNPYSSFSNIAAKTYSGVTVGSAATILAGTYSGVTLGVNNIAAATYSGVTVGATATLIAGTYSGVTVGINNVAAGTYSGVTVGTGSLSSAAGNTAADLLLLRNVAGGASSGRTIGEAFAVLRNKVAIGGSTITVFQVDDTTSMWTGSVTTVASTLGVLGSIDPQ